jgi:hypothetical protein
MSYCYPASGGMVKLVLDPYILNYNKVESCTIFQTFTLKSMVKSGMGRYVFSGENRVINEIDGRGGCTSLIAGLL